MSKMNMNPDLMLGTQELNKFQEFMRDKGFVDNLLNDSLSFGLVYKAIAGDWNNFKVELGTNVGTLKINEGVAVNKNGELLKWALKDNISLANDNTWRWIKIKHTYSPVEPYLVNVSADGTLSAPGGSLTSILRGLPNNPSVVSFPGAASNIYEYQVIEVIDDENAVLAGDFSAESNLQLAVVGSFTPDVVAPTDSKYPFQYDSCTVTAVVEPGLNTAPSKLADEEFWIARVKRNGSSIEIQDKRTLNIWRSKADFEANSVFNDDDFVVGVEAIKYDNELAPRDQNKVFLAWGFRSSNWTFDSTANRITIIGGLGGTFKSTAFFSDGGFDGWRVYFKSGKYAIIKQSTTAALQINLILDSLDPDELNDDLTQELHIVPNADEIELIFTATGTDIPNKRVAFHINNGVVSVPLTVYAGPTCNYNVKYRFKAFKIWSQEREIPNAGASGYYNESRFDANGVLVDPTLTPYGTGTITLTLASNAYSNVISTLSTGQLFGYEYFAIANGNPVRNIVLNTNKQDIIVTQETDDELNASDADFDQLGAPYQLSVDHYFNFASSGSLRNGNYFLMKFRGTYDLNGNTWKLVQNYVNPGNPGTTIYEINDADIEEIKVNNFELLIFWDGERWQAYRHASVEAVEFRETEDDDNGVGQTVSYVKIKRKILQIGSWDMNASSEYLAYHGIENLASKILAAHVVIVSDSGTVCSIYSTGSAGGGDGSDTPDNLDGQWTIVPAENTAREILIRRNNNKGFDGTGYDDTSIVRGRILIEYIEA